MKKFFIAISLLLFVPQLLFSQNAPEIPLDRVFEEKYDYWFKEVERVREMLSQGDGVCMPSYHEIEKLGIKALPFIIAKLETDERMYAALHNLSKRGLLPEESDKMKEIRSCRPFFRQWWQGGYPLARREFGERYEHWKKVIAGKDRSEIEMANREIRAYGGTREKNEIRKALIGIQYLGIAALPCLFEKIKTGETIFIPMVSRLMDGAIKPDFSIEECHSWWEKNKDYWTIPFPDHPKK